MTKLQDTLSKWLSERIKQFSRAIDQGVAVIDAQTIVALTMLVLSYSVLSDARYGPASVLASWGISPRGYAIGGAFAAGLLLRFPRSRFYVALTAPLVLYIGAAFMFAHQQGTPPTSALIYIGFWFLALKADQEGSDHA